MRVLFVTPTLSLNGVSGGMQVTLDRLAALRAHHQVTVLTLSTDSPRGTPGLVSAYSTVKKRSVPALLASFARKVPLSIYRNMDKKLFALAVEQNAGEEWDLIYCDHWLMWPAAKRVQAKYRVLNLHNAEHLLFSRAAERLKFPLNRVSSIEAQRCRNYLRNVCNEADEVHYLSRTDADLSEQDGIKGHITRVFPPKCETSTPQAIVRSIPNRAMTLGTLSWNPTSVGMSWFLEKVWPLVTGIEFYVGGSGANPALAENLKTAKGLKYLGFVNDPTELYETSPMFLAPLKDGSGIKIKIINALARGLPVVTNKSGVECFEGDFRELVFVSEDPEEFSAHIKRVATLSDAAWLELSLKCRAYAQKYFAGAQFESWCAALNFAHHAPLNRHRVSNSVMDRS